MEPEKSNVLPFRGIGLYLEELTAYAELHHHGHLSVYTTPNVDIWWVSINSGDRRIAQGEGSTMNDAVLDLYRMLQEDASPDPAIA